jgi:hypothetical protein
MRVRMMAANTQVRPFSSGYALVDAVPREHGGEYAIVADDMYTELEKYATRPLLKVDGSHYWPYPEYGVPADTVGVPENPDPSETVLLAKDETVVRLLQTGQQEPPGGGVP